MAHTPAPWKIEPQEKPYTPKIMANGKDTDGIIPICRINDCYPIGNVWDNAHLIAAAPDLLAALENLFEHCAMVHKHWGDGDNTKQADAAITQAQDAIKKARGKQNG